MQYCREHKSNTKKHFFKVHSNIKMRIKRMSQIYTTNTNRYRWYTYLLLFLCYFSRNAAAVDNHDCTGVTGDPVCNALNDERISPETFYTSAPSSIIVGTSGGISAISSLLIMFIIVRSNIRFSTVPSIPHLAPMHN